MSEPPILSLPKPREQMESLFDYVLELNRVIAVGVDTLLTDLDLSYARWQVLKWVAGGEERTVAYISRELGHSRQAVQRIVNELQGLDFLRIDRRTDRTVSAKMQLTSHGWQVYDEADARVLAWCDQLRMTSQPWELERARELIVRLRDEAKAIDDELVVKCRENAAAIRAEAEASAIPTTPT